MIRVLPGGFIVSDDVSDADVVAAARRMAESHRSALEQVIDGFADLERHVAAEVENRLPTVAAAPSAVGLAPATPAYPTLGTPAAG